jgi:hypothetical protein
LNVTVEGHLEGEIVNSLEDFYAAQVTSGSLLSYTATDLPLEATNQDEVNRVESKRTYPFSIYSSYAQDATTFEIIAQVNMSYDRETTIHVASPATAHAGLSDTDTFKWSNSITSNATYNRSLDHTVTNIQEDTSAGVYRVSNADNSYVQQAQGSEGYVVHDHEEGDAEALSHGGYICGYELCFHFQPSTGTSTSATAATASSAAPARSPRLHSSTHTNRAGQEEGGSRLGSQKPSSSFPVRHPLLVGKSRQNN